MTLAFSLPIDIANVGAEALGVPPLSTGWPATISTKADREFARCYDKLRQAELRRNVWAFATRRAILRPIDTGTSIWTPPTWSAVTAYTVGQVVVYNGDWYQAQEGVAEGDIPNVAATWLKYFGAVVVDPYFVPAGTSVGATSATNTGGYYAGELVIIPESWSGSFAYTKGTLISYNANATIYLATQNGTNQNPSTAGSAYWTPYVGPGSGSNNPSVGPFTYSVFAGGPEIWLSLINTNVVSPLSSTATWLQVLGTLQTLQILYPIGAGPLSQITTPNVFRLPNGYLKEAPTDPKGNFAPWVGGPAYNQEEDYLREGNYIVSSQSSVIMLRFVADLIDVTSMDPMFCEALGNRMGWQCCESITQAADKKASCWGTYKDLVKDARAVNGIETGTVDPAEDEYLMVRL